MANTPTSSSPTPATQTFRMYRIARTPYLGSPSILWTPRGEGTPEPLGFGVPHPRACQKQFEVAPHFPQFITTEYPYDPISPAADVGRRLFGNEPVRVWPDALRPIRKNHQGR